MRQRSHFGQDLIAPRLLILLPLLLAGLSYIKASPLPAQSGGGGGQSDIGGNVEMLTPTEGVDFTNYIGRLVATVKRNWYAVMPESARRGDRGKVVVQFRIMQNGVVPDPEAVMVGSSSEGPLDRAAIASIRASTPFEPLPPAFSGPYHRVTAHFSL